MKSIYQGEHAPCKNCQREIKSVYCHGICPDYIAYKERREQARKERQKIRDISEEQYSASMRRKGW